MVNRDPNPGGEAQEERLQIECFLYVHVPSSQTNGNDSSPYSGSNIPHTTLSTLPTSPAGYKHESPPQLHVAGMSGVKGPSAISVLLLCGLLSQYSACILYMCSNRGVQ